MTSSPTTNSNILPPSASPTIASSTSSKNEQQTESNKTSQQPTPAPVKPPVTTTTTSDASDSRCISTLLSCIPVIEKNGTVATAWAALLTLNIVVSVCFLVPFRIGFYIRDWPTWIGPDIACDLIFLLNMAVQMRTSFEQDGEEIRDPRKIEDAYIGWNLVRDVLGILPLEIISLAFSSRYEPGFRANRLVFVALLPDLFERWERLTTIKPSIIRIGKSIFVVFFCTHIMGCIFHLISLLEGDSALETFTGTTGLNQLTLVDRYFRSVYWSFVTMTGYNNTNPNTLAEAVFSFCVTLMGISLFATIIGSVGSLVTNLDSSKLYFRQKLDSINEYMSYKQIPENLQNEVRNYFLYLWKSGKGLDKNQALDQLPQYLKHKMNMFLNSGVIRRVPMFEEWKDDKNFITDIVKNLSSRIYLPRAVIVCEGDIGNEMYFISHGEVNVISHDGLSVAWTFKDGDFFGEIAILLDAKRTATIVARTYCDMSILTKDAFRKVLRRFPQVAAGIKQIAEERLAKAKEQNKSVPPPLPTSATDNHDGGKIQNLVKALKEKNNNNQHDEGQDNSNSKGIIGVGVGANTNPLSAEAATMHNNSDNNISVQNSGGENANRPLVSPREGEVEEIHQ